MNVLSLFDGISCGAEALKRTNLKVDNYFASEIDRNAIQIAKKNHPNITCLGDVKEVKSNSLPKIDLLIGGSPCTGFSYAGKKLNFNDPQSKLFFEYLRLLDETKPEYFLLENVRMKKEWQNVINSYLGVEPIFINSSLVSAQDRKRLYWTNILNVNQPKDKKIFFKDILEKQVDKSFYLDKKYYSRYTKHIPKKYDVNKSNVIGKLGKYQGNRIFCTDAKSSSLCRNGGNLSGNSGNIIWRNDKLCKITPLECERLQTLPDNYTEGISKSNRYAALGNGWTVDVISHILSKI